MIIINDIPQYSQEWWELKLGIPSASHFGEIITPAKGDYSKSANKYMLQLLAEQITGKPTETYSNDFMQIGIEKEAEARQWFEFTQGIEVKQVGLIYRDERKSVSCSPDGLLEDRGWECKCPAPWTMVQYLLDGGLPLIYKPQIQGSMFITGFDQWVFMAYHEDFDPILITVERDDEYISKIERHLHRFNTEKAEKLSKLPEQSA